MALRRILVNLVDNALRYGKSAHVAVSQKNGIVALSVVDNGPGIPEAHREDLMQPFARMETSRSRQTGGAGLGLAIVQTLVASHGGTLSISDAAKGGAVVTVELQGFSHSS